MILWSIHTFWHNGSGIKENDEFEKKAVSGKNSSPGSKAIFLEKFVFGIWKLILSRYDIK